MKVNKIVILPLLILVVLVIGTSYAFYTKTSETNRQITLKTGKTYIGIYGENKDNIELNKDYTFTIENRGSVGKGYEVYIESETTIDLSSISYTVTGDYSKTGNLSDNVLVYSALSSTDSKTINIKLTSTSTDSYKGKIKVRYKDYVVNYDYTGTVQTFNAPTNGNYKLETWGAQGYSYGTNKGGYGGYSVASGSFVENTDLYIFVGQKGNGGICNGTSYVSFPNGGTSVCTDNVSYTGSGGGSTHIALENKKISDLSSNFQAKLLIVAGGGGAGTGTPGGWYGSGGSAGGKTGVQVNGTSYTGGGGGTQTSGGAAGGNSNESFKGLFGTAASIEPGSCGGGGFYGGGGSWGGGGGGGSGYIANSSLTDKKMVCYNCTTSNEAATKTESNTCHNSNPTADCAKEDNGYARITYIGN